MNCCNDYGQCTQGHGCPARRTPCSQQQPDELRETPIELIAYYGAVILASAATAACLGGIAGYLITSLGA